MKVITLLVPNLERGGAERQAVLVAIGLARAGHQVAVAVFRSGGPFAAELLAAGVEIVELAGGGPIGPATAVWNLARHVNRQKTEILYSLLPPANVLAGLMRAARPSCRIIWGVRSADMPLDGYSAKTRLAYDLERRLSGLAHAIIANSKAGAMACERKGFPAGKLHVVANGFEIDRFRPDPQLRTESRAAWGLQPATIAIGLPARLDPVKDHPTFLRAAAMVARSLPDAQFLVIGGGPDTYLSRLSDLAAELHIADRVSFAGATADMPAAYNGLDIACLTSVSEGFPNTVGEAMACGVPCVATDVGDAGVLIGETGLITAPGDAAAFAEAVLSIADREVRHRLGHAARQRIVSEFSMDALIRNSLAVFDAA